MPGCAAPKCTSHSNKGFAFHRFPSDRERRKRWLISCRRAYWSPKPSDRLCSKHFEKSQYEQQRQDGKKLLKPFAVPTLFDVPNPPKKVVENRLQKRKKSALEEILSSSDNATGCEYCSDYKQEIQQLKNKITALETELENEKNKTHFLSDEQVQNASIGPKLIRKWSKEGIIMGLKMRYALGKNGYTFLRETGYPLPSYSTLNKRIQHIEIDFGILKSIIEMLKVKMSAMSDLEKDCSLMVDEMEISGDMDFDKSKKKFVGQVTLGDRNKRGNHLTVVALRGLNTPWKQIVAFHVTGQATTGLEMKNLILDVIHAVTQIGLRVRSIVSDMGANNKALWSELNIKVSRVHRLCQFNLMDEEISVFADAPHLLKNWKSALLSPEIFLPSDIVIEENLPTNEINGNYVIELFKIEANKDTNLRSLHHLTTDIVCPNQFSKMHVGNAMKFISFKTAAALEAAVIQKILPPAALSTAWFIRLLVQWFELVNSRKRASSITNRNFPSKEKFLNKFIDIIQGTVIKKGWKPLNTGSILSSLSFMKIAKSCITRGYKFFLGSRLSQDGLENIFSRVRRKCGMKPSALEARKALKLICLSQYISDIKNTNYSTDSDLFLLDYETISETSSGSNGIFGDNVIEQDFSVDDRTNIFYIAGSCVSYVISQGHLCENCRNFLSPVYSLNMDHDYIISDSLLTNFCDLGGLQRPSQAVMNLLTVAESLIQQFKPELLRGDMSMNHIIDLCYDKFNNSFPHCCEILTLVLSRYSTARGISIKNTLSLKRKAAECFSSRSVNKKSRI